MRLTACLAVLLVAAGPAEAQIISIPFGGPKKAKPSPNADLPGSPADVAGAVAAKGRPPAIIARDERRRPADLLKFLGLTLAARTLVVEPDVGYYSEIVGRAVGPSGRVVALVPPAAMRDPIVRRALIDVVGRTPDVTLAAVTPAAAVFAPGGFDFVLLHLALHDRYADGTAAAFISKLFAAVRPGGIVGVVDHVAAAGGDPASIAATLQRVDPGMVKADFARAGFVLDADSRGLATASDDHRRPANEVDGPTDRFVLRFVKPET